eukprot:IDg86t1
MSSCRGQNKGQSQPRKCLSIDEKMKVIADIEAEMPYSVIAVKHGIGKRQVSTLKKKRENILLQADTSPNRKLKKMRGVQSNVVEYEVCKF